MMVSSGRGIARQQKNGRAQPFAEIWSDMWVRHGDLSFCGTAGWSGEHFDLMIQVPGEEKLWTWRIFEDLVQGWGGGHGGRANRGSSGNYMTYEGDVSGGRGRVERVEEAGRGAA